MYVSTPAGHRATTRKVLLYSHRGEPGQTPVVFNVRPTVDDERGLPGIGLCVNPNADDYDTCAVMSFDVDSDSCHLTIDHVKFAKFVDVAPAHLSFAEIVGAIPYALGMGWLRFASYEPHGNDDVQNLLIASLPCATALADQDNFTSMHATVLRDICNAVGVKPDSIKKADCLTALEACRKAFMSEIVACGDTHDDFTSNSGLLFCLETTDNANQPLLGVMDNSHRIQPRDTKAFVDWKNASGTHKFIHHEFGNGDAFFNADGAIQHIERKAFETVTSITGNVVGSDWVDAALTIGKRDRIAAWAMNMTLQAEIEQMADLAKQNETKVNQLISSIRATNEVVVPDAAGEVEVMGKMLPHYSQPDAPDAIPNYSLEFWTAKQRIGIGANTVTFDALDFIDAALNDAVVSLVGPPGTGKTTIVKQAAHVLGLPCFIVQFTRDKPIESLIGVDKIQDGQQVFVDGEITRALRRAASTPDVLVLVCFDEFDHAAAEIQSDFHGLVEGRDYTLPSGEIIPNHGNLRFVLTRNTSGHGDQSGRHSAANVSDSAFNSRIKAAFNVDYMRQSDESVLLATHGLDLAEAAAVVNFADATRKSVAKLDSGESYDGMTEPVCLRHLLSYAAARSRGVDRDKALAQCIVAQLPERDRSVCNEMIVTHFKFD